MSWMVLAAARRQFVPEVAAPSAATVSAAATTNNQLPVISNVVVTPPDPTSATVTGRVTASDPDGDTITYSAIAGTSSGSSTKGSVSITPSGIFTYNPNWAARHAAARIGAGSAGTDTVTVTVKDANGGFIRKAVTVVISPANTVPVLASLDVGQPESVKGAVKGGVYVNDKDGDTLTYAITTKPSKGAAGVSAKGYFSYTPDPAARHAAAKPTATDAEKTDTFTITISDGYGGSVAVPVKVKIGAYNSWPEVQSVTVGTPSPTNVVRGAVTATDADKDPIKYSAPATTGKGTVAIDAQSGAFLYTSTATTTDKSDAFNITVSDGYGGDRTVPVNIWIHPAKPTVVTTVGLGVPNTKPEDPYSVGINGDGSRVYVLTINSGSSSSSKVWAIDTSTNKVTASTGVGESATIMAVCSACNRVFAATGSLITMIDYGSQKTSVSYIRNLSGIESLAPSPNASRLYVGLSGEVRVIDTATAQTVYSIKGKYGALLVSPDGGRLYAATGNGQVAVIDTASGTVTTTIAASGASVRTIAVSADGRYLSVSGSDNSISIVDLRTNAVTGRYTFDAVVRKLAFGPDGKRIYVSTESGSAFIDTATGTVVNLSTGSSPGLAPTPDGQRVYVAQFYSPSIYVVAV